MTILFVSGVNDENLINPYLDEQGNMSIQINGTSSVHQFLDFADHETKNFLIYGHKVQQPPVAMPAKISVLFNEISDSDSHQDALSRCTELCDHLHVPIINHPRHILATGRDQVVQKLQGIANVIVPKTIRCTPDSPDSVFAEIAQANLEFPVIIRIAGDHGGKTTILLRSEKDYSSLHVYPFDGRDFYLTQYVDYQNDDGYYSKFRLAIVDGVPLIRHHKTNADWMVHSDNRKFMEDKPLLRKREDYILDTFTDEIVPRIQPAITEITKHIQLDYFGIDCHINDRGEILIFEVNANMNILIFKKFNGREVKLIRQAVKRMILNRLNDQIHTSES